MTIAGVLMLIVTVLAPVLRAETRETVERIVDFQFAHLFELIGDQSALGTVTPLFVVGDFNGDNVPDLAGLVQLSENGRLLLAEYPAKFETLATVSKPAGKGLKLNRYGGARLSFRWLREEAARATLLAIIQGTPRGGWLQTRKNRRFVLVSFSYADASKMVVSRTPLRPASAGDASLVAPPRLIGDAIRILNDRNEGMALYWDGQLYRWYPIE
jgi:hypothetical protein